jgi:AcrR family transcriptional regulator
MIGSRLAQASGITAPSGAWRTADDEDLSPILATARDLFYGVGVTVPALYYHHANKEAILAALLDRSIGNVIERCQQALGEAGEDPADRFRNLIECLALYMANHRKSAAMDAEIRALSPAARKLYSIQRRRVEQMVADTISQGVATGVFDVTSPSDTGRALLGMIQAITLWFRPGGGRLTASELAVRYVDIAERTVGLRDRRGDAQRFDAAELVLAGGAEDQRADDAVPASDEAARVSHLRQPHRI